MLNIFKFFHVEDADPGGAGRCSSGAGGSRRDSRRTLQVLSVVIAAATMSPGWGPMQATVMAAEPAAAQAPMPQEKLDSLLAPIALYPDDLLAQTLMAATYPLDVVSAARFVKDNKGLKGDALDKAVLEKNWDPSVQSLTAYPQVLDMMNDKLEWTQELGDAFLADQKRVTQTVQSLRKKADAAGNLKSTEQQKVVKEQSVIIIEPAQPEVVYVPTYNPTVVYGSWWAPAYPPYYWPPPAYYYPPGSLLVAGAITWGIAYGIANNHWGWNHVDWHGGNVNINVNRNNAFINNNAEFKNKVSNGNWNHNPAQRKGVAYSDARTREQFRKSDPGATAARRDARGYESGSRTGASAGTRDTQRGGGDFGGASAGSRDVQRGSGNVGGASAGTRDVQRGGGDFGGASAGTRDVQRGGSSFDGGSSDFRGGSSTRSSFDSGQSRQQASSYSNRGASSRASMGGGSRGGGGGGRSGGGGGRR